VHRIYDTKLFIAAWFIFSIKDSSSSSTSLFKTFELLNGIWSSYLYLY
jgi:hypothetical protein